MTPLSHSQYFWIDTIGLIVQAGFLWFAASRVQRTDWPYGLAFVVTAVLSLFAAFWPIFGPETADVIRRLLHASTAVSFVMMTILIYREYRERGGTGSFGFNWKVVGSSFLGAMLLAWFTIPLLLNVSNFLGKRTEGQLNDIQIKAATAAGVGKETANLAEQNKEINLNNGEKIDRLEAKVNKLLALTASIPPLQNEVWALKMEIRKQRLDASMRSNIIYLPDRYLPTEQKRK